MGIHQLAQHLFYFKIQNVFANTKVTIFKYKKYLRILISIFFEKFLFNKKNILKLTI